MNRRPGLRKHRLLRGDVLVVALLVAAMINRRWIGRPKIDAKTEAAIGEALASGKQGMLKIAAAFGVGSGTAGAIPPGLSNAIGRLNLAVKISLSRPLRAILIAGTRNPGGEIAVDLGAVIWSEGEAVEHSVAALVEPEAVSERVGRLAAGAKVSKEARTSLAPDAG